MPPETIAAYAALVTAIGTLCAGGWAYLQQRAQLRDERDKRRALEKQSARKDEFEHQQALIETLQRAMEAQNTRHERERTEWRQRETMLLQRIEELEAIVTPHRKRNTGPLGG
jgi:uncharacterized protein HemX